MDVVSWFQILASFRGLNRPFFFGVSVHAVATLISTWFSNVSPPLRMFSITVETMEFADD